MNFNSSKTHFSYSSLLKINRTLILLLLLMNDQFEDRIDQDQDFHHSEILHHDLTEIKTVHNSLFK